jgi:hypothetical protein
MSHDAHDPHAPAADDAAAHGPAGIPPEPKSRSITPAPEDFASRSPLRSLLWPLGWLVAAFLLWTAVAGHGWHEADAHHDAPVGRPAAPHR